MADEGSLEALEEATVCMTKREAKKEIKCHLKKIKSNAAHQAMAQQLVKLSPMEEPDTRFDYVLNALGAPMRIEKCAAPTRPCTRDDLISPPPQVSVFSQQGSPRCRLPRACGGAAAAALHA